MDLNTLQKQYNEVSEEHSKRLDAAPAGMSYDEFEAWMAVTGDKLSELDLEIRLLQTPTMKPHTGRGHIMTLNAFKKAVKNGSFIDYDGSGNYATETEESDIAIYPSDFDKKDKIRKDFTHIRWYNR